MPLVLGAAILMMELHGFQVKFKHFRVTMVLQHESPVQEMMSWSLREAAKLCMIFCCICDSFAILNRQICVAQM